jgi:hypothetical protein
LADFVRFELEMSLLALFVSSLAPSRPLLVELAGPRQETRFEKDGIPSSEIEIVAKGKRDLLVPSA